MACNKPIIASDIKGIRELFWSDNIGILVKPEDPIALSKAIITLVENLDLRKKYEGESRKLALDKYNWKNVSREIVKIMDEAKN